jgi:hypothetical protein
LIVDFLRCKTTPIFTIGVTGSGDDWTGDCQTGKQQSPIDLPTTDSASLFSFYLN